MAFKDLTGKVFGDLTVIKLDEERSVRKKYWICQCKCGKQISTRSDYLTGGKSKSCGCYRDSVLKKNSFQEKHGMYGTRFYVIWDNMIGRCYRESHTSYDRYGGRGIEVCEEWKDFQNFYNDMYETYKEHSKKFGEKDTTIERINCNGNYNKENCCWKTNKEQSYNKRSTVLVEGLTLKEISEKYNVSLKLLGSRRDYYKRKNIKMTIKNMVEGL